MTEYGLGFAIGQITIGVLFLWLGVKGFSKKGIPLTKKSRHSRVVWKNNRPDTCCLGGVRRNQWVRHFIELRSNLLNQSHNKANAHGSPTLRFGSR